MVDLRDCAVFPGFFTLKREEKVIEQTVFRSILCSRQEIRITYRGSI